MWLREESDKYTWASWKADVLESHATFFCHSGQEENKGTFYPRVPLVVLYTTHYCHGPAGVPRLATRCLCLLSTWLVVCLVPCAPMSIVCPLPSCYVIIVSVAPAVSPSFVSLYSSPCVCSPVLIRCLSCVFVMWVSCWLCSSLLPACLFFPFGVVFVLCFILLLKKPDISAFESSTSSLVTERISQKRTQQRISQQGWV